jgi:hypothetical protein
VRTSSFSGAASKKGATGFVVHLAKTDLMSFGFPCYRAEDEEGRVHFSRADFSIILRTEGNTAAYKRSPTADGRVEAQLRGRHRPEPDKTAN